MKGGERILKRNRYGKNSMTNIKKTQVNSKYLKRKREPYWNVRPWHRNSNLRIPV